MRTADAAATQAKMKMKMKMKMEWRRRPSVPPSARLSVCPSLPIGLGFELRTFTQGPALPVHAGPATKSLPVLTSEYAIIPRGITIIIRP